MSNKEAKVIQWKELWQLTSGIYYEPPKETVLKELRVVSKELLNGIKISEDNSKTDTSKPSKIVEALKSKFGDKLTPFVEKLKHHLELSQRQAWEIFCAYLIKEYHGSTQALLSYLASETNTTNLLESIWNYNAIERMTQLKVLKNMLEYYQCEESSYMEEYDKVLSEIGFDKLRKSYVDQLVQLISVRESPKTIFDYANSHAKLVLWAERTLQETNEVLQILLLIVERNNIKPDEFKTIINLFKAHSFGRQQQYLDLVGNAQHIDLVNKITNNEIALFIKCIDVNCSPKPNRKWLEDVVALLDNEIIHMHQSVEHGPILLVWMLANFQITELSDENEKFRKYRQFGVRAVRLGVFGYLRAIVSHPMFRDKSVVANIVRTSIYNQLSTLCNIFDGDGAVAKHPNIYELLCELLTTRSIAKQFCENGENGARSLYTTAMEEFPLNFEPLSMIANALTASGRPESKFIRNQLENLVVFTEQYSADKVQLRQSQNNENEFILLHDYSPFGLRIDYVIKAGTVVSTRDNFSTVHFYTKLNYFNALHHEINELIDDTLRRHEIDEQRKRRVTHGIRYLAAAVQRTRSPADITTEMVHPTELVFDILVRFKVIPQAPVELLAECLEVCAALVRLFPDDIYSRIVNLNVLPFISNELLDYESYSNGVSFDSSAVGYYLVTFEKTVGRYEFLMAYLRFLSTLSTVKFSPQSIQDRTLSVELPGLIFLLREVLPYIHSWRFENEADRHTITTLVLQNFIDALPKQLPRHSKRHLLRDTCAYSLLHLETGMTVLRFVALGNNAIESKMLNESNWIVASKSNYNELVEKSMMTVMKILELRYVEDGRPKNRSPLESVIYSQPKYVIPVVTAYMSNMFNRDLPVLACGLLQLFALEFQMSMLACLDMEPAQIRSNFLDRLENELELEELKAAIIQFVEACINKQLGLTEAFFKTNNEDRTEKKAKRDQTEGILAYMALYLKSVKAHPRETIDNKLLQRVMSLFHSLWKNNMQSLVEPLLDDKNFWTSIMQPLFVDINPNSTIYSQCFNMLGLELYRIHDPKTIPESLRETLKRLLSKPVFITWVKEILIVKTDGYSAPDEWLSRIQCFKDLLVIVLRRKSRHGIQVNDDCLTYLANKCLERLVQMSSDISDLRPFIILSELYQTLLLSFDHKYTTTVTEDRVYLGHVTQLLNSLSMTYGEIHNRAKDSILAIALKTINLFSKELVDGSDVTLSFAQSISEIIAVEITATENALKAAKKAATPDGSQPTEFKRLSFVLCFNIFKTYLNNIEDQKCIPQFKAYITSNCVLSRLLSCLHLSLSMHSARRLSYEMLDLLVTLARGPFSNNLLNCDIDYYLWLNLLPPKELLQDTYLITQTSSSAKPLKYINTVTWQPQDWWPIYTKGVQLVTNMLQKHGHLFVKNAVKFVGVHEEYLMDSILLAKYSLDDTAMQLIKSATELVCDLIQYEKFWRLDHMQSMVNLMRCIQVLLDYAVSLLSRPKVVQRLTKDTLISTANTTLNSPESFTLTANDIETYNKLIEIITICLKCLLGFSPKLLKLLNDPDFMPSQWQPLIDIQFTAPKLNIGLNQPQLTFGTILRAAGFFTKTLIIQQYTFHETPLNMWSEDPSNDDVDTISNISAIRPATARRNRSNYSTSTSIISTASHEVYSNVSADLSFTALEYVLTLLASQSLLALKDTNLSPREKQLIKREISSELHEFQDFVRKRVQSGNEVRDTLQRKKHGVSLIRQSYDGRPDKVADTPSRPSLGTSRPDSMRVIVTRRAHLNALQSPTPSPSTSVELRSTMFNMSQNISTIRGDSPRVRSDEYEDPASSTPAALPLSQSQHRTNRQTIELNAKRLFMANDDPILFDPEDRTINNEWRSVNLVEEDYLIFLANLFSHITK